MSAFDRFAGLFGLPSITPSRRAQPATRPPDRGAARVPSRAGKTGWRTGRADPQEARERLEPLEPGERPGAVTAAALVAALLLLMNLAAAIFGYDAPGGGSKTGPLIVYTALLGFMTWGLWRVGSPAVPGPAAGPPGARGPVVLPAALTVAPGGGAPRLNEAGKQFCAPQPGGRAQPPGGAARRDRSVR